IFAQSVRWRAPFGKRRRWCTKRGRQPDKETRRTFGGGAAACFLLVSPSPCLLVFSAGHSSLPAECGSVAVPDDRRSIRSQPEGPLCRVSARRHHLRNGGERIGQEHTGDRDARPAAARRAGVSASGGRET